MTDTKRKEHIIKAIEELTMNKLEQLNVQELMRTMVNERKNGEEKEEDEKEEYEEDGELLDEELNDEAYRQRLWAKGNVWKDYLEDVTRPLKRRVRTSICLSLRVPPAMQKELEGTARFNRETKRIEEVTVEDVQWSGTYDPFLHRRIQDIKKQNKEPIRKSNPNPEMASSVDRPTDNNSNSSKSSKNGTDEDKDGLLRGGLQTAVVLFATSVVNSEHQAELDEYLKSSPIVDAVDPISIQTKENIVKLAEIVLSGTIKKQSPTGFLPIPSLTIALLTFLDKIKVPMGDKLSQMCASVASDKKFKELKYDEDYINSFIMMIAGMSMH